MIVGIIAIIKLSYRALAGSPMAIQITYQYKGINIAVTIAAAI